MQVAVDSDDNARPPFKIALWGSTSGGKTSYLASLQNVTGLLQSVRDEVDQIPTSSETIGIKEDLTNALAVIERRFVELSDSLTTRDQQARKASIWQFAVGLAFGLPLGVLGSLIAYWLGIN